MDRAALECRRLIHGFEAFEVVRRVVRGAARGAPGEIFLGDWEIAEMPVPSKRLDVVENGAVGFFDPITLASQLDLAWRPARDKRNRTDAEMKIARTKALSKRVARVREDALAKLAKTRPWIARDDLLRQASKNHPVVCHASLLGQFVNGLYPRGGVHVDEKDASWIARRAPELPSVPDGHDVEDEFGVGLGDGPAGPSASNEPASSDGPDIDVPLVACSKFDTRRSSWWTSVDDLTTAPMEFGNSVPPWHEGAKHRLVSASLPQNIDLTIDPLTGLVCASDIASALDKRVMFWLRLGKDSGDDKGTRGLAFALAAKLDTTPRHLAYVVDNHSTWIHIRLVVSLASWCRPAFAVHADDIVIRYFSGELTTEESREARRRVDETVRPADPANGRAGLSSDDASDGVIVATAPAPGTQHRMLRTRARASAVRCPHLRDTPIPSHLLTSPGVYAGGWGVVKPDDGSAPWWHLKVGKAAEQAILARLRAHSAEKPHTWVTLFVAGCDGGMCHFPEATMVHFARHVRGLEPVGNSPEEFKVPVPEIEAVVTALRAYVMEQHRDILVSTDAPSPEAVNIELEKHRLDKEVEKHRVDKEVDLELKKHFLSEILRTGDAAARDRAIESVLGVGGSA